MSTSNVQILPLNPQQSGYRNKWQNGAMEVDQKLFASGYFTGTGSTSGASTTLTIDTVTTGYIYLGMVITGAGTVTPTVITAFGTGTGGTGTYTMSQTCTIAGSTAITGSSYSPLTNAAAIMDRYVGWRYQAYKIQWSVVADAPPGFKYSLKAQVSEQLSPAAADYFGTVHRIEGVNCRDLAWGTASALPITMSFYVKGSVAGTYDLCFTNSASNRSYLAPYQVTTSWVKQTVTIPGCTDGVWLTDSGRGLQVSFDLGTGSTYGSGTAGVWASALNLSTAASTKFVNQVAGSTINITGIQFESGSVATPFEQRPYGVELWLCRRYNNRKTFTANNTFDSGMAYSTTIAYFLPKFEPEMRIPPALNLRDVGDFLVYGSGTNQATTNLVLSQTTTTTGLMSVTTGAALVAGQGALLQAAGATFLGAYIEYNAEL